MKKMYYEMRFKETLGPPVASFVSPYPVPIPTRGQRVVVDDKPWFAGEAALEYSEVGGKMHVVVTVPLRRSC